MVSPETTVLAAIAAMQPVARPSRSGDRQPSWESSANCVIVVDGGRVVGILTASDVVRLTVAQRPLEAIAIAEVMSQPAVTMAKTPTATVAAAIALLRRHSIRHLPMVNPQGNLMGLVTQDSLFALLETGSAPGEATQAEIASAPFAWEMELQTSQHYLTDILNNTKACICSFRLYPDYSYEYDYYSQGSELIYGYAPRVIKTQVELWRSRVLPEDLDAVIMPAVQAILEGQTHIDLEFRFRHRDGSLRWIGESCTARWDQAQRCWITTSVAVDISDRKGAELALRQSEAKSRAILAVMPDLMFRLGADGCYREVINPRPDLELFFKGRDPVGRRLSDFAPPDLATRKLSIMQQALATRKLQNYEQQIETPAGWRYEEVRVVKSGDDEVLFMIRDITESKRAQVQIIHNSLHDPLTGLPNRTLLSDRINAAIHRAQRHLHYQYAVLFLDLDRFKGINDSLGHSVGDQLLMAIAQKLRNHIRAADVAARLGGDEFVLLLEDIDGPDKAVAVVERILADCQTPLRLEGHEVLIGVSVGIAIGNARYHEAADLIRDADIAMYRAKHRQRGTYQFFDPAMHTQVLAQHTLELELYRAIEQSELAVYYQPVIDLDQARPMGFEALVRWPHPTQGLLTPDVFLPCAEATGLIVPLDHWVLRQTCQQLGIWQRQFPHHTPLGVSVNLSAQNFATASLLEDIDAVLAETGVAGNCLNLEITENMMIQDMEKATYLLTQLAERGIRISIDDFGVGHSSLQYLHRFPLSHLKIDRSFVQHLTSDNRDYAMVQMILGLSQQLGLSAIAEGIETPQQLHLIKEMGCQFAQGYLFSKPLPADAIEAYLDQP
ncbi:EAL domain-containing protein [Leptolyngbya sp. CCNP1308]|nr:EAL domain-containing protein [Leptolyngbya sp. CCNP1308]